MRPRLASWSLWRLPAQPPGRCGSSGPGRRGAARSSGRRGAARSRVPLRHRVALWTLPRLLIFPTHDKSPARAGLFLFVLSNLRRRLTSSNDDDASSGGANDGGDASPNACDANGDGANPSACDASPSAGGPSRDDGRDHGPNALLPA